MKTGQMAASQQISCHNIPIMLKTLNRGRILFGEPDVTHFTFLIRTTSLMCMPRDMARRLSGDIANPKIASESNDVSFLGALPSSGKDQILSTPFSVRAYRIALPFGAQAYEVNQLDGFTSPTGTASFSLLASPPATGMRHAQSEASL